MDQNLLKKIPEDVFYISKKLLNKGFESYLVGGSIRDLLIGITPADYDIATNALPQEIQKIFPHSIDVGAKFGTIKVFIKEAESLRSYEITTYRNEGEYLDSRRPSEVSFNSTIEEDLKRRDFTINAFALNLQDPSAPFLDLFNGKDDLKNKVLRAVGDPSERFKEDALRMLKACRLAAQLDFNIEENTFKAIKELAENIRNISAERVRDEFVKILNTKKPSSGIELLRTTGLLKYIVPELLEGYGVEQNQYHIHDVYSHLLASADIADKRVVVAALFHDIGKPRTKEGPHFYSHEEVGAKMTEDILKRLKFPTKEIDYNSKLVKMHMFNYTKDWSDAAVRRFLSKAEDINFVNDLFLLRRADALSNKNSDFDLNLLAEFRLRIEKVIADSNAFKIKDLALNGNDLIENGIVQGPQIGEILNILLERVIDNPSLNNKEDLLNILKEINQ